MKTPEEIKKGLEYVAETNVTRKVDLIRAGIVYQFTEDLAADALALIQLLEAQAPKWTSVEERLPENTDDVLIVTPDNVSMGYYDIYHNVWYDYLNTANEIVTYWMPLP